MGTHLQAAQRMSSAATGSTPSTTAQLTSTTAPGADEKEKKGKEEGKEHTHTHTYTHTHTCTHI